MMQPAAGQVQRAKVGKGRREGDAALSELTEPSSVNSSPAPPSPCPRALITDDDVEGLLRAHVTDVAGLEQRVAAALSDETRLSQQLTTVLDAVATEWQCQSLPHCTPTLAAPARTSAVLDVAAPLTQQTPVSLQLSQALAQVATLSREKESLAAYVRRVLQEDEQEKDALVREVTTLRQVVLERHQREDQDALALSRSVIALTATLQQQRRQDAVKVLLSVAKVWTRVGAMRALARWTDLVVRRRLTHQLLRLEDAAHRQSVLLQTRVDAAERRSRRCDQDLARGWASSEERALRDQERALLLEELYYHRRRDEGKRGPSQVLGLSNVAALEWEIERERAGRDLLLERCQLLEDTLEKLKTHSEDPTQNANASVTSLSSSYLPSSSIRHLSSVIYHPSSTTPLLPLEALKEEQTFLSTALSRCTLSLSCLQPSASASALHIPPMWCRVEPKSGTIPARSRHSGVLFDGQLLVFGGFSGDHVFGDLFAFDVRMDTDGGRRWRQVATRGSGPSAREYHTAAVVDSTLWIYGGQAGTTRCADLFSLDLHRGGWQERMGDGDVADVAAPFLPLAFLRHNGRRVPLARSLHSMVVYRGRLFIFGGHSGRAKMDDLWMYSPISDVWEEVDRGAAPSLAHPAASSSWPTARSGHSAVVWRDAMYVYGGHDMASYCHDIWCFTFSTGSWSLIVYQSLPGSDVALPPPASPPARTRHSAVVVKNRMVVVGGNDRRGVFSDVWMFDLQYHYWTQLLFSDSDDPVHVTTLGPSQVTRHVAVTHRGLVYVMGGSVSGRAASSDVQVISLGDEARLCVQASTYYDDLAGLLKQGTLTGADVCIRGTEPSSLEEYEFWVHKPILCCRSEAFRAMLGSHFSSHGLLSGHSNAPWRERQGLVCLSHPTPQCVVAALLEYLYTDRVLQLEKYCMMESINEEEDIHVPHVEENNDDLDDNNGNDNSNNDNNDNNNNEIESHAIQDEPGNQTEGTIASTSDLYFILDLMQLADVYLLPRLLALCEWSLIIHGIRIDDVCEVLIRAKSCNANHLINVCLGIFERNPTEVATTPGFQHLSLTDLYSSNLD